MNKRQLVVIVGPTAVGKTSVAVQLAKHFACEIVSCDSRQFYKELAIGTAKPTPDEMQGVPHHFVNSHAITQNYSAGDFERDALVLFEQLFATNERIIMTGGSGLFVKAITHGLDNLPEVNQEIRSDLMNRIETEGFNSLVEELKLRDPKYAAKVDLSNTQRVVRALEVCIQTGKPFSEFHINSSVKRDFEIVKIGLDLPREKLYERINLRTESMLAAGLVEEVKSVAAFRSHNALNTVGYKEVFEFLDEKTDFETMKELIKRNTRRYAKRQLTWFRNQDSFEWFSSNDVNEMIKFVENQ
ncbi:MAG: tRNA dimethylallyltransferase [Spirosomataceae bacterium]|jgi:tRNA dimethylallyltransferase